MKTRYYVFEEIYDDGTFDAEDLDDYIEAEFNFESFDNLKQARNYSKSIKGKYHIVRRTIIDEEIE